MEQAAARVLLSDAYGNTHPGTGGRAAQRHPSVAALPGAPVVFSDTAGALVKFVWVSGGNLHNIAWDPGDPAPPLPNSPNESALNASFILRVTGVGRYGYHCAYHGGVGTGVFGVIVTE